MFEKTVVTFLLEPYRSLPGDVSDDEADDSQDPPDMVGRIHGCGVADRLEGHFGDYESGARYMALVVKDADGRPSHQGELFREYDSEGKIQYRGFLEVGPFMNGGKSVQYMEFELKATRQYIDGKPSAIVGTAHRFSEIGCDVVDACDTEHLPLQLFF